MHASALCFWVPLRGTWEHKTLAWVGYKLWRWGKNFLYEVHFFQFGENTQWIMDGFALGRVCPVFGHGPLLHQSTMGLAQISTKLQSESQVTLYSLFTSYTLIQRYSVNNHLFLFFTTYIILCLYILPFIFCVYLQPLCSYTIYKYVWNNLHYIHYVCNLWNAAQITVYRCVAGKKCKDVQTICIHIY